MKILFESVGHVGDCAIDVPVIRALASVGHQVEVSVSECSAEILVDCDFIVRTYKRVRKLSPRKIKMYASLLMQEWDVVVSNRGNSAGHTVSMLRQQLHLNTLNARSELFAKGAIFWRMSIIEKLVPDSLENIDASIPFAQHRLFEARKIAGLADDENFLIVAPGASLPDKMWPAENFAAVISHIACRFARVLIIGSAAEMQLCTRLAQISRAESLAGQMSLSQAGALVSAADMCICNDSGLGHVAAANGVSTLAVGNRRGKDVHMLAMDNRISIEPGDDRYGLHHRPWGQHMLPGNVFDISPSEVIGYIERNMLSWNPDRFITESG